MFPYLQLLNVNRYAVYIDRSIFRLTKYRRFDSIVEKHTLKVIEPKDLEFVDKNLYRYYYSDNLPLPTDKIQAPQRVNPRDVSRGWDAQGNMPEAVATVAKIGKAVDDALGTQLGIAEELTVGKKLPVIGNVLAGLSIVDDIASGSYYSAAGTAITTAAGWYGLALEVGMAIYESDNFIIQHYKEAKAQYDKLYNYREQAKYRNIKLTQFDHEKEENARQAMNDAWIRYNKLMNEKYPY